MKKIARLLSFLILILILNLIPSARAGFVIETAYGRKADISELSEIVKLKNIEDVVYRFEEFNLQIYKVKISKNQNEKKKETFAFLKEAPISLYPELEMKMLEIDSGSALFSSKNDFLNSKTNIILIADDASPMTIFHEFIHHLFEIQNPEKTEEISKEQINYEMFLRRFNFKTRKVMLDNSLLISKKWRDEIKELAEEYVQKIDDGQGIIAAEEIAIESALVPLMQEGGSIFFELERSKQGINNYSRGLITRSESLVYNIFALNDLIITEGINQDPNVTDEEKNDWSIRKTAIEKKLNKYLNGPIFKMRESVKKAQEILASLETK